jgi:hypothetical protein
MYDMYVKSGCVCKVRRLWDTFQMLKFQTEKNIHTIVNKLTHKRSLLDKN